MSPTNHAKDLLGDCRAVTGRFMRCIARQLSGVESAILVVSAIAPQDFTDGDLASKNDGRDTLDLHKTCPSMPLSVVLPAYESWNPRVSTNPR